MSQGSLDFEQIVEKVGALSKGNRIAIFCITMVAIVVGFFYLFYAPISEKITRLTSEYEKSKQELSLVTAKAAKLQGLREEKASKELQFKEAKSKLPDQQDIPELLTGITRSGQDAGLDFSLFNPKPEVPKEFYAEIPVAIAVSGSYHNVTIFFDNVSRLNRIVNINDIKVYNNKQAKADNKLTMECTAVTYKFVENMPEKKDKKKR
ncbi:MAG: type 4a pilus biogenesis protein PilO [Desulfobacterales bacterium]|nr:type 4a pilus biogenesis protein PilO [Desulfobacterales bacterium]